MDPQRRKRTAPFVHVPHRIMESEAYRRLSNHARALLFDLVYQHRHRSNKREGNNGDLHAAFGPLRQRGLFRSKGTLHRAIDELLEAGLIERTRQGGRNRCSLYALTWHPIASCDGKLDVSPTRKASNRWKDSN
ncbi:MAG: hypothetical protein AAGE01_15425 [Pseudomonadota bacterium]